MTGSCPPMATLTISRGPGAGRRFDLGVAPVTIGRNAQCNVCVDDVWLSRRHARIAWSGTEYIIEDLQSTNGTYVNGRLIDGSCILKSGDRLQLGDQVEFAFQVRAPASLDAVPVLPGRAPSPRAHAPLPKSVSVQKRSSLQVRRLAIWVLVGLVVLLSVLVGGGAYYLLSDKGQQVADTPAAQAVAFQTTATHSPVPPTDTPYLPPATPTPSHPAFSKSEVLEIPSISAVVGEGRALFARGEAPGELRVEANGTVPVVQGQWCPCCLKTIRIEPDLQVPTTPHFLDRDAPKTPGGLVPESITIDLVLSSPASDDATEFIVSGPEGATLTKVGKGFLLVEGEAYFLSATVAPTQVQGTDTPAPTGSPLPPISTPSSTATEMLASVPPTATPTKQPHTPTPKPPTPTTVPLLPTPVDWAAADWTEVARIILRSAKVYRPQMTEVQALLGQDPTECLRLAQLLDSLASAPQYKEVAGILWDHRDRPGTEGQLYSYRDAYADGVNQFRLDVFRAVSNACAAGTQPTAEQRQGALRWMDQTDPIGKMDFVISNLDPEVGP
jgi:hypothetical protein